MAVDAAHMTWWQATVLGLVEGITEYLPVSSTGHLILANAALGLQDPAHKASVDAFSIVIQGGAILAVLLTYSPRVRQMIEGLLGRDPAGLMLVAHLTVAFLPAAVFGVLFDDWIEAWLFAPGPVVMALALGGVWMIWLDRRGPPGEGRVILQLTWKQALGIGLFQCVAMWPGTSRSMMTIAGGRLLGLRQVDAAEFSFLLGLPTLGGACVYKLAKNLRHAAQTGEPDLFTQLGPAPVGIGSLVALVSAAVAVRWLVGFLNRHGLAPFGWYRLVLAAVLTAMTLLGLDFA